MYCLSLSPNISPWVAWLPGCTGGRYPLGYTQYVLSTLAPLDTPTVSHAGFVNGFHLRRSTAAHAVVLYLDRIVCIETPNHPIRLFESPSTQTFSSA